MKVALWATVLSLSMRSTCYTVAAVGLISSWSAGRTWSLRDISERVPPRLRKVQRQLTWKHVFFPLWRRPLELTDQPGRRRALIRVENTAWMGMAQCCVRLAARRWPPPGYKDHWRLRRVQFLQGDFESVEASRTSYFTATVVDTPLQWPNADVATGYDSLLL